MGVDFATHRLRIGFHAARSSRAARLKRSSCTCSSHWNAQSELSLCMVIFVMTALCTTFLCDCALLGLSAVATSNCCSSIGMALAGKGMHLSLNVSLLVPGSCYSGYSHDLSALIHLSGDVEQNPGPELTMTDLESALKSQREEFRKDIAKAVAEEMKTLSEQVEAMSCKFDNFEREMSRLRNTIAEQGHEIEELNSACESYDQQLQDIHEKLEEQERRSRRDNVLLYGIPETEDETYEVCQNKFVEAVGGVLPDRVTHRDVVRAHRIGRKTGKNRPMIARLVRTADKLALLGAREQFRAKGMGISGDLTVQQRQMVQHAREEGNVGYFRGNMFITRPRESTDRPASQEHLTSEPEQRSRDSPPPRTTTAGSRSTGRVTRSTTGGGARGRNR